MTSPFLLPDVKLDEGLSLTAYPDPLSGGEPYTIGYGHTGPEVYAGLVWTVEKAEATVQSDVFATCNVLDMRASWWRSLCDIRQDVVANASFNLGVAGFLEFHKTIAALQIHDYDTAANELMASKWATQVKGRAARLSQQLRTGVRAPRPIDPKLGTAPNV